MSYSSQTPDKSDTWATTTDLTILREKLLDLFCQLAYQEGDFVLSSGQRSSYYINGNVVAQL